jgi:hypothetical protein
MGISRTGCAISETRILLQAFVVASQKAENRYPLFSAML